MFSKHIPWCCQVQLVLSPAQQLKNNIFLFLRVLQTFQYLFAYSRYIFSTYPRKTFSLFNVKKTNHCPCICRRTQKDVITSTIDLHVTYDANVITAVSKNNLRLVHDKRKTKVRFLQGIPSPNKIVRDTYEWHLKRQSVLRCTLSHLNTILNTAISHGSHGG